MKLKPTLTQMWESPVLTTWGGLLIRSAGLAVMMPLILANFPEEEVALWYLFASLIAFQVLFQFGFVPTFIRCLSYARAGAESIKAIDETITEPSGVGTSNVQLIYEIIGVIRRVYVFIIGVLLIFILFGSPLLLWKPIQNVEEIQSGWLAWILVAVGSLASVYGTQFAATLQGMSQVPLFRRNEMAFSFLELVFGVIVLVIEPNLVYLALNQLLWRLSLAIRLRAITQNHLNTHDIQWSACTYSKTTFQDIWPATWRSGIGSLASTGSTQLSGIVYAQLDNPAGLASYLIGLRLVTFFSTFSMAPFYSRIPDMAKLYGEGKQSKLLKDAGGYIRLGHLVFSVLVVSALLLGERIFQYLGSDTSFPDAAIWILLSLAFLAHRHGAYFIQLFSLSNKIIWHIADSFSAVLVFLGMFLLVTRYGMVGLPAGILIGMLSFYFWYPAFKCRKMYHLRLTSFEISTFGPALLIMILGCLGYWI